MTNQEKDLKNAREYLDTHQGMDELNIEEIDFNERDWLLKFLTGFPKWLEQKGVIKFTGNRHNAQEVHRDGSVEI
jgi:hypothetical protein